MEKMWEALGDNYELESTRFLIDLMSGVIKREAGIKFSGLSTHIGNSPYEDLRVT